ncbi:hypothetical protein COU94_02235 [Candidatus Shapirobacteria bacterium CG10_big_fil_rev_8_21_14_0_10_38_8]|nr:MAG: hypothetical protein COU94_02235 [Candidatus Shapirobacteria bacterium CG10_big_fil_rev_8_21_14_0_10_38_8]
MKRQKIYLKHIEVANSIRNSNLKENVRLFNAIDLNLRNKGDQYYFDYCKSKGYSLVTLDNDFMNDKKYPFSKTPGIMRSVL